jgi:hypothetical protein
MSIVPDVDIMILPVIERATGIDDHSGANTAAWPNPAVERLNIPLDEYASIGDEIIIMDASGRVAKRHAINAADVSNGQKTIDVRNMPAGNYFYIFSGRSLKYAESFLIMR